jgi:hypothetical protein
LAIRSDNLQQFLDLMAILKDDIGGRSMSMLRKSQQSPLVAFQKDMGIFLYSSCATLEK